MEKGTIRIVRTSNGKEYFKTEAEVAAIRSNPLTASKYSIDKSVKAPAEVAGSKDKTAPKSKAAAETAKQEEKPGAISDTTIDENQQ